MQTAGSQHKYTNKLANENSPYLLSHAHNPVNWYPWGDEALEKAQREDKPIFLSIGYAACHWCHVMERESFENEEIAKILNEHYVSIKVDREQRPDLDHIYMAFTQAMSGGGGWPMSVFLSPDRKPFFAGTYFPPEDHMGRPGFKRVITEIARAYNEDRTQVVTSADQITAEMSRHLSAIMGQELLTGDLMRQAAMALMRGFDQVHGGFGQAPKFPHATELLLFLRHYKRTNDESYREAVLKALTGMACGGIYDQLGGGFARYSVDARWLVPHFEKMLYDNALLVPVYVEAYRVSDDSSYLRVVRETLDFVLREMTHESGGFYSAIDADSEGEEGKFYVWSRVELDTILGGDAQLFNSYYNVTEKGNFEGKNILHITADSRHVRDETDDFDRKIEILKQKVMLHRDKRVRPLTDDKILTSWNGLMLCALCVGYQVTGDRKYLEAARKNAQFVHDTLYRDGRLTHSYREGNHSRGEFLEDYGYYLHGLVELYQTDPSSDNQCWLAWANELGRHAVETFMDGMGTLFLREADQKDLIVRPKDEHDGALPAAGSYLIHALMKLGRLAGDNDHTAAGQKAIRAVSGLMAKQPAAMSSALLALDYHLDDKIEIVIVGEGDEKNKMVRTVYGRYLPNVVLAQSPDGRNTSPLFEGRSITNGEVTAYVCRNSACRLPVTTATEFEKQLDAVK